VLEIISRAIYFLITQHASHVYAIDLLLRQKSWPQVGRESVRDKHSVPGRQLDQLLALEIVNVILVGQQAVVAGTLRCHYHGWSRSPSCWSCWWSRCSWDRHGLSLDGVDGWVADLGRDWRPVWELDEAVALGGEGDAVGLGGRHGAC